MSRKADRFPPLHDHMPPADAFPSATVVILLWSGACFCFGLAAGVAAAIWGAV